MEDRTSMSSPSDRPAYLAGIGVLFLTTLHHVYGAILYDTPERYHAVAIAAGAFLVMAGGRWSSRRWPRHPQVPRCGCPRTFERRRIGWWLSWGTNAGVCVLLFGAVEGFYNHVVKVTLYLAGLSEEALRVLYPDPTYELPNDVIFELTGVLQVVPAGVAAYYLIRVLRERQ
jgi:hypothetical protein